jgi:hypothetical protein
MALSPTSSPEAGQPARSSASIMGDRRERTSRSILRHEVTLDAAEACFYTGETFAKYGCKLTALETAAVGRAGRSVRGAQPQIVT